MRVFLRRRDASTEPVSVVDAQVGTEMVFEAKHLAPRRGAMVYQVVTCEFPVICQASMAKLFGPSLTASSQEKLWKLDSFTNLSNPERGESGHVQLARRFEDENRFVHNEASLRNDG